MSEPTGDTLSDAQFHQRASAILTSIEADTDRWLQQDVIDIDTHRTGGLLELSFPNGSKIVVNLQPPLHEIWVAARQGGFHFRHANGQWLDTRDGSTGLYAVLDREASAQAGRPLSFSVAA